MEALWVESDILRVAIQEVKFYEKHGHLSMVAHQPTDECYICEGISLASAYLRVKKELEKERNASTV